ncbi:MAG: Gfo/Idh/MocA family oxidoreductase [Verrucomicrobiota bacterium]
MSKTWKVAGINFDHFHMGDLLRMVHEHPEAELVGISDETPSRMEIAAVNFGISGDRVFTDYAKCLEATEPDLVVLCPAAARHAEWTEKVAPYDAHILVEKPFAGSLVEADRMIDVMKSGDRQLAINWPLRWMDAHHFAYQLVQEGAIGDVAEVHTYGGNRGPLYHGADKLEREPTAEEKAASWFYSKSEGGGSLLDYMGYGATLGTWYLNNRKPIEVLCMTDHPEGLEVDEHAVAVARYESGLSKFETRWGTFTDPWTHQPQPKCGFVLIGTEGTLAIPDYTTELWVQTRAQPAGYPIAVPPIEAPYQNPIQYFIDCLNRDVPVEGPLSVEVSRIGQQIVDTAFQSAREKKTLALLP